MSRIHALLGCGLTVLACAAAPPAEETPQEVLAGKGLRQSGATFLLRAEDEVKKAAEAVEKQHRQYRLAETQQRSFEQGAENRKGMIETLTRQRSALNQQYQRMMPMIRSQVQAMSRQQAALRPQIRELEAAAVQLGDYNAARQRDHLVEQHNAITERIQELQGQGNQLTVTLNELSDRLDLLRRGTGESEEGEEVRARVGRSREAYLQALQALRALVDSTTEQYATLADDPEVTGALETLNQGPSRTKYALGPSQRYQSVVVSLEQAEARVQTEAITLRTEGGVHWIDVTLNGKVVEPMVFDTGASLVTLPADLAACAGLKPAASDPTVQLQTADGTVVEAKLMTLGSVRVGPFTVEGVRCAVMPADKVNVPPLLGGSFLQNFLYKISPASGTLDLTRVDEPEER